MSFVLDGSLLPVDKVDVRPRGAQANQLWDQDWNRAAQGIMDVRDYVYANLLGSRKVVYVDDYVTTPSDACAGVALALAALAGGGGMLVWGAKTYVLQDSPVPTGLVVPANVGFCSVAGPALTTIVRSGTTAYMFDVSAGGFRSLGITYDLDAVANFPVAIYGETAHNTVVEGNIFKSTTQPQASWTVHAVLLSGSCVRVQRNRTKWTQLKCDTGHAGPGLWVRENFCEDSFNMGISCVTFGGPSAAVMTDVWCDDNYCINPSGVGIYLGSDDNTNAAGASTRWHARGNKVLNFGSLNGTGIYCRPGTTGEGWLVHGNQVDGGSSPGTNSRGIAFEGSTSGGVSADVHITHNQVRNTDIEGIRVVGAAVDGMRIAHNVLRNSRGILLADGDPAKYLRNVKVHSNDCYGTLYGCHVQATAEVDVDLRDNDFSNTARDHFGLSYGLLVEALAAAKVKVRAAFNRAGDFRDVSVTDRQSYGIREIDFTGATWNTRYEYNDLRANQVSAIAALGGAVLVSNVTA